MDEDFEIARELFRGILEKYKGKELIGVVADETSLAVNDWIIGDKGYAEMLFNKHEKTKNNLIFTVGGTI